MFKKVSGFLAFTLITHLSCYAQVDHKKVNELYQVYKSENFQQHEQYEQFKAQLFQVLNSLQLATIIPNGYKQAATYHCLTGKVTFQPSVFADVESISRFRYNSWIERKARKAKINQNLDALLKTLDSGLLIRPNLFAKAVFTLREETRLPYEVIIPHIILTINEDQSNLWQVTIFYEELENDGWTVSIWSRDAKTFSNSMTYTYNISE